MKKIFGLIVAIILFSATAAQAQNKDSVIVAQSVATTWLRLIDTGDYAKSWDATANIFQISITKANWQVVLDSVRSPLGSVKSRTLKSATFTKTLPHVPDGQYVVIQYETQFEHKQNAIETITPMLEKDGAWRVSGYYVK